MFATAPTMNYFAPIDPSNMVTTTTLNGPVYFPVVDYSHHTTSPLSSMYSMDSDICSTQLYKNVNPPQSNEANPFENSFGTFLANSVSSSSSSAELSSSSSGSSSMFSCPLVTSPTATLMNNTSSCSYFVPIPPTSSGGGRSKKSDRQQTLTKNRRAAAKSRQRKKEYLQEMEVSVNNTKQMNEHLSNQISDLKEEIINIKMILASHTNCSLPLDFQI